MLLVTSVKGSPGFMFLHMCLGFGEFLLSFTIFGTKKEQDFMA